jgi:hypothetical protein
MFKACGTSKVLGQKHSNALFRSCTFHELGATRGTSIRNSRARRGHSTFLAHPDVREKVECPVFARPFCALGAEIIRCSPPADRASVYAEQYGRCIAFLARAARALGERRYVTLARQLADEAVVRLPENGWFQGSPDSHLYEAVDGVGYLFLALIELETGESAADWGGEF